MNLWVLKYLNFGIIDILDIAIVSVIIYFILRLFRGTRAPYILLGTLVVVAAAMITKALGFPALSWIIDAVKTVVLVALVIIFQPEIRRALGLVGQGPFTRAFLRESKVPVDEIAEAAFELRERGLGAIIVVERQVGLREFTERGIQMEVKFTAPLAVAIFAKDSPLHDGAMVVKGDKIIAVKVLLPLSHELPPELYGTRHRAAVGITEVSDAVAVVVSEERQNVRVAVGGKLSPPLSREGLVGRLRRELGFEELAP